MALGLTPGGGVVKGSQHVRLSASLPSVSRLFRKYGIFDGSQPSGSPQPVTGIYILWHICPMQEVLSHRNLERHATIELCISERVFRVQKTEINGRWYPLHWSRDTLYPPKLTLISLTCGGRSGGIVWLRTKSSLLGDSQLTNEVACCGSHDFGRRRSRCCALHDIMCHKWDIVLLNGSPSFEFQHVWTYAIPSFILNVIHEGPLKQLQRLHHCRRQRKLFVPYYFHSFTIFSYVTTKIIRIPKHLGT
jgi:hypothetical protein